MSYYTMAMEFWTAVVIGMGVLPLAAVSIKRAASAFGVSPGPFSHGPMSARTAPVSC
jgi:hypothetical protein